MTRVRRERYTEERWRGLLEQPAWELEGDPNAEANAWALVRAATKLSELEVALGQDLERVRAGEASTPEVARLNFKSLAVQIPNNLGP